MPRPFSFSSFSSTSALSTFASHSTQSQLIFPHLLRAESETPLRPRSRRMSQGSFKSRKVPPAITAESKDNLSPKMQILSDLMGPQINDSFKASASFMVKQINGNQSFNSKKQIEMPIVNLGAGSQRNLQVLRRKSDVSHVNSQKSSSTSNSQFSSKSVTSSKGESNFMVGESNLCYFPYDPLQIVIIKSMPEPLNQTLNPKP